MEKFNRAVRRHHAKRIKKVRSSYWGKRYPLSLVRQWAREDYAGVAGFSELSCKALGILLNTPQYCNCYACHNPRWRDGKTLKERSFIELVKTEE